MEGNTITFKNFKKEIVKAKVLDKILIPHFLQSYSVFDRPQDCGFNYTSSDNIHNAVSKTAYLCQLSANKEMVIILPQEIISIV